MTMKDIALMGAGFADSSFGSQAVFRSALHALSHPGECVQIAHDAETPTCGHSASAALLLALLDPDCKLWLSPSLANSEAAHWLRFHTGCAIVDEPNAAQFAWVAYADELPPLDAFSQGTDTYPDQSATCIVEVAAMTNDESCADWVLTGPGIRAQRALRIEDSPNGFVDQWARNRDRFPRGVDVFFVVEEQIVGLPRTTRISGATNGGR
jgi:alpha-D-ribose 1-methylphosphonate 5-triphosphate synthase subunit PhnH